MELKTNTGSAVTISNDSLNSRPNASSEIVTALPVFVFSSIAYPLALTAGLTITSEPVAPGTAPLTNNKLLSASTRTTTKDLWLLVLHPCDLPSFCLSKHDQVFDIGQ